MNLTLMFRVVCYVSLVVVLAVLETPAPADVITTGDAAVQPDPWAVGGNLYVGRALRPDAAGTLNVEAGGVVSNSHGYLGYYSSSTGEATVTGAGSQWDSSGVFAVGNNGTGVLNVESSGVISNTSDGFIGRYSHSTGEATVTGAGSQWNNSDDLWIGGNNFRAGGTGTLNLNDSGLVTVAGTTKLWSTGTLNLDGGNLTTGSFDNSEGGTLNFHDGQRCGRGVQSTCRSLQYRR